MTYMHIKGVNAKVIGRQIDTLENLPQGQMLAITKEDHFIWGLSHLAFDEAKEVLLIHACRVMNVSVDLAHVVKIAMRYFFTVGDLLIFVEQRIQLELAFQVGQPLERKAFGWAVGGNIHHGIEIHVEVAQ